MVRRRSLRLAWGTAALVLAGSCTSSGDDGELRLLPDETPSLLDGRTFELGVYEGTTSRRLTVTLGSDAPELAQMLSYLEDVCAREAHLAERFDSRVVELGRDYSAREPNCGVDGARQQQLLLCIGHKLLGMSESVMPLDFTAAGGGYELRARRLVEEIPERRAPALLTIPVQDNESRATLAIWSMMGFQRAALLGAHLTDPGTCADGSLAATLPPYEAGGPRVPMAFVVASATSEAMHQMLDAAERGRDEVRAAAAIDRGRDNDARRGAARMFRGRRSSLLAATGLFLRAPARLFDSRPARLGEEAATDGELEVCVDEPDGQPDTIAMNLVETLAIDPRVTPDQLSTGVLEGRVRDALVAREAGLFEHLEGASDTEFFRHIGTSVGAVRRAGERAETRARVLGRVIVDDGIVDGVPRVRGTSRQHVPARPAFQFARVAGAARIHHEEADGLHPAGSYGEFDVASLPFTSAGNEYGRGPALEALDLAATALSLAVSRADMSRVNLLSGETMVFDEATELAVAARVFGREQVPLRAQVCIGNATEGGVDRARIRLFGADSANPDRYEVWIGEAGLQCATTGRVEGVPCVDSAHRVTPATSTEQAGATRSGFGSGFVEADFRGDDTPEARAVPMARMYVTERQPFGGRRVVLGFTAEPSSTGSGDPTWNRCANLPAGRQALDATDALATDGVDCSQPATSCAGVPYDVQIPLEDEIAEALGGLANDDLETSFAHYLSLARQAADEADALGQQLVQHGLELDLRAEAAAEEVQRICGITIPVLHLPGTQECMNDAACEVLPGNHGPGAGYSCVGASTSPPGMGTCEPNSVLTYVEPGPDAERVAGCLGLNGQSSVVNLGDAPVCVWRVGGGAPCATSGAPDLQSWIDAGNSCPWAPNGDGSCERSDLPASAGTPVMTEPLYLVSGSPSQLSPGSCNVIASIIHDPSNVPLSTLNNIATAPWRSQHQFDQVAATLRWQDGPLSFSSIRNGASAWASLGSMLGGPNHGRWPCARRPDIHPSLCDGSPANRPLACGFDCTTRLGRSHAAERLMTALGVMQRLAGRQFGYVSMLQVKHEDSQGIQGLSILGDTAQYPELADNSVCQAAGFPINVNCVNTLGGFGDPPTSLISYTYYGNQSQPLQGQTFWIQNEQPAPDWDAPHDVQYAFNSIFVPYSVYEDDALYTEPHPIPGAPVADIWIGPGSFVEDFIGAYVVGSSLPPGDSLQATFPGHNGAASYLRQINDRWYMFYETPSYRGWRPMPEPILRNYEVLHGLELGCLALNTAPSALGCGSLESIGSVDTLDGLERAGAHVQCAADTFEAGAARLVLSDVPSTLAEELRQGSITSTYPAYGGQYGSTVASLQAELQTLPQTVHGMANAVRDVGIALSTAASAVRVHSLQSEYAELSIWHATVGQLTQCLAASASAASIDLIGSIGNLAAAAITCTGGYAQLLMQVQMTFVQLQIDSEELKQQLLHAAQAIAQASDRLQASSTSFNQGVGRINALLAELDSLRSQARGDMAKALVWSSDAVTGQEYPVNSVMRARLSTDRIRYERAHRNAVRLAWLARRAIEQRLGVDLDDLTQPMTLVDPPSEWAESVCGMGGINYAQIRGELEGPVSDYADQFVGDYVRQLELFLQSYRIDHPFENGRDVAVVSLRDDVLNVRESCDLESYNLFTSSIDPTAGWTAACDVPAERCPTVSLTPGGPFRVRTDSMGNPWARPYGSADAFNLGSACPQAAVDQEQPPPWFCDSTIAANGGSLHQSFELAEGTYLVSWYEPLPAPVADCEGDCVTTCGDDAACLGQCEDACVSTHCATVHPVMDGSMALAPQIMLVVAGDDTLAPAEQAAATTPELVAPADPWLDSCTWRRAMARITVPVGQTVEVGFRVDADPSELTELLVERGWAAPQLEALAPHEAALPSIPPRRYFPTDGDRVMSFALCPDGDGSTFRSDLHWERGCEYLCGDGFGEACASIAPSDRARVRCFRETRFRIGQDAIERGELLSTAGFALGNYNYRFATLAVNVVGTEVLDCTTAENRSACYANAYVPYSLYHDGPFVVRNHWGEDYDAPLFPGRIQHAKGLTAERYLTNPLSGADRGLLTDYWRTEFRGRPLPGEYRLRVYDTPGLQWESVEDVQLLVDYQYWTRSR